MHWIKFLIIFFLSAIIPQIIKVFLDYKKSKNLNILKSLFETGGMPSSHASLISAITTSIFLTQGPNALFFFALAISTIIIRDATGVRFAVGEQAKTINKLIDKKLVNKPKKVKIILGHTPTQALAGIILGVIISLIIYIS